MLRYPINLIVQTGALPMIDVLADLLDTMRLGTLVYGRLELAAPWGFQLPDSLAAHIVAVGRGSARLEVEGRRALRKPRCQEPASRTSCWCRRSASISPGCNARSTNCARFRIGRSVKRLR